MQATSYAAIDRDRAGIRVFESASAVDPKSMDVYTMLFATPHESVKRSGAEMQQKHSKQKQRENCACRTQY